MCRPQSMEVMVMQSRRLLAFALMVAIASVIWMRRHALASVFASRPALSSAPQAMEPMASTGVRSQDLPAMVPSVDGLCPETHPVKANPASRIYHLPHHRAYHRLGQPVCFVDADAAEAKGYRASKQ